MSTAKTANQIKDSFQLLASGHLQINSFAYDQEFNQQAYPSFIYPLMFVDPLGGSLSGTTYTRTYRVAIADRVLKSEDNKLEVLSDTQLIILDVLAYWMKLGQNERFTITSTNTITPFYDKWGDEVTGHFVDIGIEEFYDFNSCAIPLSGSIPTPVNPCKDARISVNSVVYGNAPSDSNFNVVVKDQLGALVGSLIGGEWIVNTGGSCADATYTIEDTLGNVLYTGSIVSGGNLDRTINNSTLNVNKSDGSLISSRSILAEGTDGYNVSDSLINVRNSKNNIVDSANIKATETGNLSAPDGLVNIRKTGGLLINAISVASDDSENYEVDDSLITNAAISPTYSQLVKSTEGLILPTQEIQNNGVASGFIPSVGTINVTTNVTPTSFTITGRTIDIVVPSGVSPSGVLLQRPILQQYTSFANYDEGWRNQNGWNSAYVLPANPKVIAQLDYSLGANYWYRLKDDLIVGGVANKIRFVDVDGGQTWSATGNKNLITIDKYTGLGIYRNNNGVRNWVNNLNNAESISIVVNGVTYNNFYLAALCEYLEIFGDFQAVTANTVIDPVSSATFGVAPLTDYATATTTIQVTTQILNRTAMTAIVNSNKVNSFSGQYIFDASSLITAP